MVSFNETQGFYYDFQATSFRNIQGQRQLLKNSVFSSKLVMAFFHW